MIFLLFSIHLIMHLLFHLFFSFIGHEQGVDIVKEYDKKIFNSYALVMASTIVTIICRQLWKKGGINEY